MKIVRLSDLKPETDRAARFQGADFGADTSFFVVTSPPGRGVNRHRHPYQETLIILEGEIEMVVDGHTQLIKDDNAIVVPAKTWHSFINKSPHNALLVTIHASPKIIQENWKKTQ
jgi:quercetin dioxygenase-like cupin family protein